MIAPHQPAADPEAPSRLLHWSFILAVLIAVTTVVADPLIGDIIAKPTWQRLRLIDFPLKASLLLPLAMAGTAVIAAFVAKTRDMRSALLILTIVALQTNGIKILPGLDLITALPFFVLIYLFAEGLRKPSSEIHLGGVMFFAALLLLLDLPYFAATHVYGPPRFVINFFSTLKALLVAFVFINLVRTEQDMRLAIRWIMIVAVVSAGIGVMQMVLNKFTGMTLSLVSEEHETKPTFFGTVMRASGLTTWSSWLADFLVLALPLLLYHVSVAKTSLQRLGYLAAIALLLAATLLTFTYAAYAAVAVILVLFPFFRWPRLIPFFLVSILFFASLFYIVGGFDWLADGPLRKILTSSGMIERKIYLQSTIDQLVRDPWLGSGFYAEEEFSGNFYRKRVHNTGLQAWANLGLPGFLAFLAMMMILFTQIWLLAFSRNGKASMLLKALGLGMIGMIVEMFAEPNLTHPITWYYLGLCQAAVFVWNTPTGGRRAAEIYA